MSQIGAAEAVHPQWWELVRALWPVFAAVASLAVAATVLALRTMFVDNASHRKHGDRLVVVETFVIEQKAALGLLPSRQELGHQISKQGERLAETREELGEAISEVSERVAGVEQGLKGMADQLRTANTYLHTIIERGLKP